MIRRRVVRGLLASFVSLLPGATLVTLMACSDSSAAPAVPCNEDPWECPAGRTCWPVSTSAFDCLISGTGKAGDPCQNTTNAPSCGDGMACLAPNAAGPTLCAAYCDASHACPAGTTCTMGSLAGTPTAFQVCLGTPVTDAGGD
jgi:hypothetical protein